MSGKKLIFAVSAIVIAVLVIVLGEQLGNNKPTDKVQQFFPSLTSKDISAFEISEGAAKIRIQRKGDVWIIGNNQAAPAATLNPMQSDPNASAAQLSNDFEADSASLISVLDKITTIKKSQLVSKNPEKQAIFEVDSLKGMIVEVFDLSGKSRGSVRIGKNGPDYSSNYVRATGSNDVYMVEGSIKYSFFTDKARWEDKTITKFDRTTAQGITIKKKDSLVVLTKAAGDTWNITAPIQAQVKADEVSTILSSLSRLTATAISDSAASDSAAFVAPELTVTVAFAGGTTKNVIFGTKNGSNQYRVKTDGKSHVYLIDESEFKKFTKTPEELKVTPPASKDSTITAAPATPAVVAPVKKSKK